MTTDKNNPKHLIADEGKVLVCTKGFPRCMTEVFLDKVYVHGVAQEDTPKNWKEYDAPTDGISLTLYGIRIRKEELR